MSDFDTQAAAFRASVERELENDELTFPTSFSLSLRIKERADDPTASLNDIAQLVMTEPVLSARLVRLANSAAANPYRSRINGVMDAVRRIGLSALRSVALAVAAEQLAQDQRSKNMRILGSGLWKHSLDTACWAWALARQTRGANADAALFAGMMSNVGTFFLIARAAQHPELENHIDRFAGLVHELEHPVGVRVLERFELPEDILDAHAAREHYDGAWPPKQAPELLFLARHASTVPNPLHRLLDYTPPKLEDVLPETLTTRIVRAGFQDAASAHKDMFTALGGH